MAKNIEMQYYNGTSYEVCYPKANLTNNVTGILPLANGGTGVQGLGTSAGANAIIKMNENGTAMWYRNTANGAFYATADNGMPNFGTLPIAQGGTGATSASAALTALGAASASTVSTLSSKVSTLESKSSAFSLKLIFSEAYTTSSEYSSYFYFPDMRKSLGILTYNTGSFGYKSSETYLPSLYLREKGSDYTLDLGTRCKYGHSVSFTKLVSYKNDTYDTPYHIIFATMESVPYIYSDDLSGYSDYTITFTSSHTSQNQCRLEYSWSSSGEEAGTVYLYSVEVNV